MRNFFLLRALRRVYLQYAGPDVLDGIRLDRRYRHAGAPRQLHRDPLRALQIEAIQETQLGVRISQGSGELKILKKVSAIILLLVSSYALAADEDSISTTGEQVTRLRQRNARKPPTVIRPSMLWLLDFRSSERADGFADVPDLKVQAETKPADRSLTREFISSCWALSLTPAPQLDSLNSRGCARICREPTPSGQSAC